MKLERTEDYYKKLFPGKITNCDIIDGDTSRCLEGTGNLKGFEKSAFDRHLKPKMQENQDFMIISEKIWHALSSKYGFDLEVKRFY